ncbi:23S rRNA (adenine(2503)-C(2))-methyltransferase RlmN [bacterium]|nr:MAG: 23S rRNA (adenine(2503)-C(2))-methyltransferase RlmN [bacterium]
MMRENEEKLELFGIPADKLGEEFEKIGEQKFRAKQVMKWIYEHRQFDFAQMTDLPLELRDWLNNNAIISIPETAEVARSEDNSAKFLFKLSDGKFVESVYIPDLKNNRHTVCLSAQIGCKYDCSFCATGKMGFVRNLTSTEIIGQLYEIREYIQVGGNNLTNVVFMGMGEPMDNLDAVIDAIKVILADVGFGLGHRRVLVSTVGIPEGILKLMKTSLRTKLAISLNAPNNKLRTKIMPVNKKYSIESFIPLIDEYVQYCKRWVTMEYVMLAGINDSLKQAHQLVELLKGLPVKINLIPYNPIEEVDFKPSDDRTIMRFQSYLLANSVVATIRQSSGKDIKGACGQLIADFTLTKNSN